MGLVKNIMIKVHKRSGDRFAGMDLLYLTTVGAKSGKERVSPVARFADGDDAWLVVASNGGADRHPSWYHNLRAHPDQVWVEVGGRRIHARVEQLEGERRRAALERIVAGQPRFGGYQRKTDRALPVLRLSGE
ncbi:nitroreductase family deazaflavin-dependent oxidoreductase [Dactylosporangium fulvum]|uniref:Nitroreductase family deazaflavin-dependent oxidoreductase n=1 Tax=Dactylosporangium fulvum TaxID=53359 RepID=A0ABY5W7J9_9ACTN|nr:nitroreductase family deazaflavin-dependent oxidoreductase [Dactylosporangium fulvum]UWP85219.1 nitroreductase family deazaflavin-dependent oxidoreductase [Dactylosporangium fulvum]